MVGRGWDCMRALTNGGLWKELYEDSDQFRIVDGTV